MVYFWKCEVNSVDLFIFCVMRILSLFGLNMNSLVFGGLVLVLGMCMMMLLLFVIVEFLILRCFLMWVLIVSVYGVCIFMLYGECRMMC